MYFTDEWFDVVACNECGLGFVNPRPDLQEISRFYRKEYYDWFIQDDHANRYGIEAGYLPKVEDVKNPPFLLDIGCGVGDFPRFAASMNWRVEGVEPFCPVPIEDFPVFRQPFDTIDGLENRYDAITAWAVLEHVHDPLAYFLKAGQALKKGGAFVFLVTNFDSLSSKRLFQEDVPRHLHFFTQKTVEKYLEKAGMELVKADFNDDIFSMGSRGALNFLFTRYIRGKAYEWEDRPAVYPDFLDQHNLKRCLASALKFICTHPVTSLDHIAEPLVERWQKLNRTYGMATYVARKIS